MELDKIYLGDCLEVMQDILNESIDAIICDLPYGVLNKSNPHAQWDEIIPFEPLWNDYKRIIKANGAIILFAQGMFTARLMMSNPKWWRYNLVWDKVLKNGFLNANRMPLRQHEDICMFYKNPPAYNPQMVKCEPHQRNHTKGNGQHREVNRCYGSYVETPTIISDEKFPTSVVSFPKEHINGKSYHPTEKPVSLIRWLIRTYTDMGGVILDNTCGSGSTCVAAIKEKRHFIGIEKDEKYWKIACERVKRERQQLTLF